MYIYVFAYVIFNVVWLMYFKCVVKMYLKYVGNFLKSE